MSDLNREQFEKYAKSKGWENRHLKQRDDGGYEDWGVHPIWLSWQASRECLVIEMPPEPEYPEDPEEAIDDSHMDSYHSAIRMRNACRDSINAAGVKTK